jgi:branched-chain amino acid transport system substrate-binding protein
MRLFVTVARGLLAASIFFFQCSAWSLTGSPGVLSDAIRLGMSSPMSGTAGAYGQQMKQGIEACFAAVNGRGGVHGRRLELVSMDDGYETDAAVANAKRLIDDKQVFALMAFYGSSATTAVLPVLADRRVPLIGSISGAEALRHPSHPEMFNLRASYADETAAIMENLTTVGISRIAVFYQDDGFGRSGLKGAIEALARHHLTLVASASVPRNSVDVAAAARAIAAAEPQAIIMATLAAPSAAFVRQMYAAGVRPFYVALSPVGTDTLVADLGPVLSRGIEVAQVMPFPWGERARVVRDYRRAMQAYDRNAKASYYGLEGYINARVMVEALERAGAHPTRERLKAALREAPIDLGGYSISFAPGRNEGSRYVEISVVGDGGHIIN